MIDYDSFEPYNSIDCIDRFIQYCKDRNIVLSDDVQLKVMLRIKKVKVQLYFKDKCESIGREQRNKNASDNHKKKSIESEVNQRNKEIIESKRVEAKDIAVSSSKPQKQVKSAKKQKKASTSAWTANSHMVDERGFIRDKDPYTGPIVTHRDTYPLLRSMKDDERRARNGDKHTREGYSSTGVPLPTRKELSIYHETRNEQRAAHDRFLKENPERKKHGKMIVYIPSGGQNKKY